jgi:hypothetical protein
MISEQLVLVRALQMAVANVWKAREEVERT